MMKKVNGIIRRPGTQVFKIRHSFGLFVWCEQTRRFLVVQNRDSHAFVFFFMIDRIDQWTTERMRALLEEFTSDEINRLLFFSFDDIYNDLYLNHDPVGYHRQEVRARRNYNTFHRNDEWVSIARTITGIAIPWELPKGRLNHMTENSLDCAIRETREETNISLTLDDPSQKPGVVIEHIKYKKHIGQQVHVHLFGISVREEAPIVYRCFNKRIRGVSVSDEIMHARWVDLDEASVLLPTGLIEIVRSLYLDIIHGNGPQLMPCSWTIDTTTIV